MQTILFLCTGNYYRSRFAEHLFNHLAEKQQLHWQADSRALALERGVNNIGAISHYAKSALAKRGIILLDEERFPQAALLEDFQQFTKVIAIDESEHRPLMAERFPEWLDNIEYWLVHDIDKTGAEEALGQIEINVMGLAGGLV
ncbi:arsenate-mycothiol transferase ArsC [Brunnivagina elsteri]|uniref:Low molecular weight phosphatase family protein n=1 Tax=Brunnivagina elsteri CCALA 953 TaxID=987040 RepID=A0A2A2THU1_9CYAN|nr:low molecular weight phosphatase family protein [Calothrix elsteri]PAX53314.1 low molecular weight phosphatase family protein [Calothrix elsteri CCALA 953]